VASKARTENWAVQLDVGIVGMGLARAMTAFARERFVLEFSQLLYFVGVALLAALPSAKYLLA
jgi:hypothetical protein